MKDETAAQALLHSSEVIFWVAGNSPLLRELLMLTDEIQRMASVGSLSQAQQPNNAAVWDYR